MTPPSDRAVEIFTARVHLTQSRVFLARGDRAFSFTLLQWAQNARRRAQVARVQGELFAAHPFPQQGVGT